MDVAAHLVGRVVCHAQPIGMLRLYHEGGVILLHAGPMRRWAMTNVVAHIVIVITDKRDGKGDQRVGGDDSVVHVADI